MPQMKVNTRFDPSDEFEYQTRLERINLDKERRTDVLSGNGFIIDSPKALKDDIKNELTVSLKKEIIDEIKKELNKDNKNTKHNK